MFLFLLEIHMNLGKVQGVRCVFVDLSDGFLRICLKISPQSLGIQDPFWSMAQPSTTYHSKILFDGSEIPNNHRLDGAKTWEIMGYWPYQLSNEKNPGWLGHLGDYTTQLYRDYNKPL